MDSRREKNLNTGAWYCYDMVLVFSFLFGECFQDHNHRGYHAHEEECLDPERQTSRGDTKELFSMGVHIPPAHPMSHLPMHGPNLWPNPGQWRECGRFRGAKGVTAVHHLWAQCLWCTTVDALV